MDIRLIVTDIDGVWTDGGMYYTESGDEFKKFNTADSVGVLLAEAAGIKVIIITNENSKCVENRARKLKIRHCYTGVRDKLSLVEKILAEEQLSLGQVAYIGDEINDHHLLRKVGLSACPNSAPGYTKELVDCVIPTDGGKGAFRDFVIEILKRMGSFDELFLQISEGYNTTPSSDNP